MRRILTSLAAIAMGIGAAVAMAGTASAASGTVVFKSNGQVVVKAATGFNNNITVRRDGGTVFVKDTSDLLIAVSPCTKVGTEVSCPSGGVSSVEISTFDGADRVASTVTNMVTIIRGGEGNDNLFGSSFAGNRIFGDGGNDFIVAGDSIDILNGGSGDDTLFGFAGNDEIFGNAGFDTAFGGSGFDFCSAESESGCE